MSADERVKIHAQRERDSVRRFERERVAAHPAFDSRNLPGADSREPLELALVQAGSKTERSDATADVATDSHAASMTAAAGDVDGERWFIVGDFDPAEWLTVDADVLEEFKLEHAIGHGGPGWYYWSTEYPEEGAAGPYATRAEAIAAMSESYS